MWKCHVSMSNTLINLPLLEICWKKVNWKLYSILINKKQHPLLKLLLYTWNSDHLVYFTILYKKISICRIYFKKENLNGLAPKPQIIFPLPYLDCISFPPKYCALSHMTTVKVLIMKYCKLTAGGYFMLFHASQKQPPEQWLKLLPRVSVQVWSGFTVVFWQFHKNLHTSKIQMNVYENARCGVALYFPTQLLAFIILNQDGIKKINRDKK